MTFQVMEVLRVCLALLAIVGCTVGMSEPNIYDPVIQSKYSRRAKPLFYGVIREDETTVQMDPPLRATDDDRVGGAKFICAYEIVRGHKRGKVPFVIEMTNRTTGEAEVRVKEGHKLDFEKRAHFKMLVVARDCGTIPRLSDPAVIVIEVKDVDEFAPVFEKSSYMVEVEEGGKEEGHEILTLKARDADRSPTYHGICNYEILTPNVPFSIDANGVLRTTEALDFNLHRNYILKVVAMDCGKKKSKPVFVNVAVREVCQSGWQDLAAEVDYQAGSGHQEVAKSAHLRVCEPDCKLDKVNVALTLATKHIGKGCDRDTYSITSQRKICGASGDSVDLLPSPSLAEWTRVLPTDDGHESDEVFAFDGETTAVEVPASYFNHSLSDRFTLATWMKHDYVEGIADSERPKEHIFCMSDNDHMSRHHYALFVHGEKLVFLLRQEATTEEEMEVFKPAQWRWHILQINDGEWHHYAISVDFPQVDLLIDGQKLVPSKSNLQIADDWPVHRSSKVHGTRLVIGGCWQGSDNKIDQFFKGFLAGLTVVNGKTESDSVIQCLNNCKESLSFQGLKDLPTGMSVSFNHEMTEFKVQGRDPVEVEKVIRKVTYVNARSYPTPGRRSLSLQTWLQCADSQAVRVLPLAESYVMVREQPRPIISISGPANLSHLAYVFEKGLRIFNNVSISASPEQGQEEAGRETMDKATKLALKLSKSMTEQLTETKTGDKDEFLLDSCTIQAEPPLNLFYEHLSLPTAMMESVGLEWSETNDGVVIINADKIDRYVSVIHNIHYYHNQPEILNSRKLTLSCSSQNQRFISNKFHVELVALHQMPQPAQHAAHVQADKAATVDSSNHLQQFNAKGIQQVIASNSSNFGMAAIIVVCVGFLLFMIILGVIRIRAAHRRTQVVQVDEKQEMEWDNSGLNITVNPMEQEIFEYEDNAMQSLRDDTDSDDDGSSFHDDGDSSDEEPREPLTKGNNELEWDHSNLGF